MSEDAVCPFGNTLYDSRIFDKLYRVWGSEDGGTILTAYWNGDLKSFKTKVPYVIISQLIEGRNIGSLCGNYDWEELNIHTNNPIEKQSNKLKMRIVIDINPSFDLDNYENLKKILDVHIEEIMKADPWRGYPNNKNTIKFSISCFEPKQEEQE